MTAVAAVDFGATSVRVCRVDLSSSPPALSVVHRLAHQPVPTGDGLRWDWPRLVAAMEEGLRACGPIDSIGVDTWGVDYGLLDDNGDLIAAPYSYRDGRTAAFGSIVERDRLFAISGLRPEPFNTIFQLAVHTPAELSRARHVVMLPELLVHHLTGAILGEYSSAGTTGLLDLEARAWSRPLCETIGIDPAYLPPLHAAGHRAGSWGSVPVHLVGGHDTASAVIGMGPVAGPDTVFVSAGTWLLVGREQETRSWSPEFSNEIGAAGGLRVLRNVAGFWVLEQCFPGGTIKGLLQEAAVTRLAGAPVDLTDPAFLNPPEMLATYCTAAGIPVTSPPPVVARSIIESMAATCATVTAALGPATRLALFGGGGQSGLLRDRLAALTGLDVVVGPVEATALGNALVQGLALGCYGSIAEARAQLTARVLPSQ